MSNLYIVGTPIGNMEDITYRAVKILQDVDIVLCEDTRVTSKIFQKYNIDTPRKKLNAHMSPKEIDSIIDELRSGKDIAIVTDAGTPSVSDPGYYFIQKAKDSLGDDISITPIPGVSALTTLVSVADISMDEFIFYGFLPQKKGRSTMVKKIMYSENPAFLFESPYRIEKLLEEISSIDPDSHVVLGRELTKMYEQILYFKASQWRDFLQNDKIKGEFSLIVKPSKHEQNN